jgi:Replication initiator protein A
MSSSSISDKLERFSPISAGRSSIALCDSHVLMSLPFFSLSKTPRVKPIDYMSRRDMVQVEAANELGFATIWDADILIWATSQLVHAQNHQLPVSRLIQTRAYDILSFLGWGDSKRSYERLRSGLRRLKATRVTTSIGPNRLDGIYRFSWVDDWREARNHAGRSEGLEILLSEWFFQVACRPQSCLRIDWAYLGLRGGIERWLFRLVRKHGGRQEQGWLFELNHLHQKSGSLLSLATFTVDLRDILERVSIPGYELSLTREIAGREMLRFKKIACGQAVNPSVLSLGGRPVLSGNRLPCYHSSKVGVTRSNKTDPGSLKIDSKIESKIIGESLVNNASSDRLEERPDPQAFGLDIGVSAPENQPALSTPSANATSLQIFPPSHSFWPLEARDASQTERSGVPHRALRELLSRKRIPLPGEPS